LDVKSVDFEILEAFGEDLRVGGLNVLVYIWWCLFEDEGPEVGDLGDEFCSFLV
jgi:hypothetical protein